MTPWRSGGVLASTTMVCAIMLFNATLSAVAIAEDEYTLGVQDKVKIGIVEWLPNSGDFRSPINGEFVIGPSGYLSLPLVGNIPASGLTPEQLAEELSNRLKNKLGLTERPETSVEVVQFRPFYILGHVERPGEYPYRPKLTVLQALSLAGGLQNLGAPNLLQLERDASTARADISATEMMIDEYLAREARLLAELTDAETINFPMQLIDRRDDPHVARLLQLEQTLFESRRVLHISELEQKKEYLSLLKQDLQSQQHRLASLEKEKAAVEAQIQAIQATQAKGLLAPGRALDLTRAMSEIWGKIRDLEALAIRTRQEQMQVEEAISNAATRRRHDASNELISVRTRLTELRQRLETSRRLIRLADMTQQRTSGVGAEFQIIRDTGQRTVTISDVSESTPLKPGDILKVQTIEAAAIALSQSNLTHESTISTSVNH